jgi:hypothetical protein
MSSNTEPVQYSVVGIKQDLAIAIVVAVVVVVGLGCGSSRREPLVVVANSRVDLAFANELGAAFVPQRVEIRVDGQLLGQHVADKGGSLKAALSFPAETVPAGEHQVAVHAVYRGEGHGVFSYLKEYSFNVKSRHEFRAPPLKTIAITAVCFEKGGLTTELSDRPTIRWVEEIR